MYIFETFDGKKYGTAYDEKEVGALFSLYAIRLDPFEGETEVVFRDNIDLRSFVWEDN